MATVAAWEQMQIKTFTNWCNMHLAKKGTKIGNVCEDLRDGVSLIQLLEIIGESTIPKYVAQPKMRIQMIENLGKALQFIEAHNVKLASIGPESICDGNRVQTLGMVWTIILRFAISDLTEEGLSAKQGLLAWCQKKTADYDNVDIKDFQDSFKDGLAFCALIHKHRPDLLDYSALSKDDHRENLNLAFDVADKSLGIPKLLDTEDIVSMPKPDERSIMTYCASLYKVFSANDKAEIAGHRLERFIELLKAATDMIHDYEARARALREIIDTQSVHYESAAPGSEYLSVLGQLQEFKAYRKEVKILKTAEQQDLAVLLSIIHSKLKSLMRPDYVPPEGLSTPQLEEAMAQLNKHESRYRNGCGARLREVLEATRQEFAVPANEFFNQLTAFRLFVAQDAHGELDEQIAALKDRANQLDMLKPQLPIIKAAEDACDAANIEENQYSDHTYDDLDLMYHQTYRIFLKKIAALESQASETKTGVSPQKMAEFQASFTHFDDNRDGHLDRLEFKACITSLGLIDVDFASKDDSSEKLFMDVTEGHDQMSFEMYVKYMLSLTEDTVDPVLLAASFRLVSGQKDFVTTDDLSRIGVSKESIEFLESNCPMHESGAGYNFGKWLA